MFSITPATTTSLLKPTPTQQPAAQATTFDNDSKDYKTPNPNQKPETELRSMGSSSAQTKLMPPLYYRYIRILAILITKHMDGGETSRKKNGLLAHIRTSLEDKFKSNPDYKLTSDAELKSLCNFSTEQMELLFEGGGLFKSKTRSWFNKLYELHKENDQKPSIEKNQEKLNQKLISHFKTKGTLTQLSELIEEGADFNVKDEQGNTILTLFCTTTTNLEHLKNLLPLIYDLMKPDHINAVNNDGNTAIMCLCKNINFNKNSNSYNYQFIINFFIEKMSSEALNIKNNDWKTILDFLINFTPSPWTALNLFEKGFNNITLKEFVEKFLLKKIIPHNSIFLDIRCLLNVINYTPENEFSLFSSDDLKPIKQRLNMILFVAWQEKKFDLILKLIPYMDAETINFYTHNKDNNDCCYWYIDSNSRHKTILMLAIEHNKTEIIAALKKHRHINISLLTKNNDSAFMTALNNYFSNDMESPEYKFLVYLCERGDAATMRAQAYDHEHYKLRPLPIAIAAQKGLNKLVNLIAQKGYP